MPFDPKIIAAEDPPLTAEGDIDLPADLTALGEQLRADALHLANCYPGSLSKPIGIAAEKRRRFGRMLAATLCGSIVAASSIAFGVFHLGHPLLLQHLRSSSPGPAAQSSFVSSIAPSETISLSELSEPELEAVLDLMEREPSTPVSVSF